MKVFHAKRHTGSSQFRMQTNIRFAPPLYTYQMKVLSGVAPYTFTLQKGAPGMTLSNDGLLSWPPPEGVKPEGRYLVHCVVQDATGAKVEQRFELEINGTEGVDASYLPF